MTSSVRQALQQSLLVGLALAVVVGAAIPWSLPSSYFRTLITHQLAGMNGLQLRSSGRLTIALLPRPRLKLEDVHLQSLHHGMQIDAASIRADVYFASLLTGDLALGDFDVRQPTIRLDGALVSDVATSAPARTAFAQELTRMINRGVLTCKSGTVILTRGPDQPDLIVDNLNLRLDWRALARPASLRMGLHLQGMRLDVSAFVENPATLLADGSSLVQINLKSAHVNVEASGTASHAGALAFMGKVKASTPDLATLVASLPGDMQIPAALTAASLEAQANLKGLSLELADLDLGLMATHFDGSMALHLGRHRPLVSATLATDALDISPYLLSLTSLVDGTGALSSDEWPRVHGPANVDLRVSASRFQAGWLSLEDAALGVTLNSERAEASIADATLGGGTFKARVSMSSQANGAPRIHAAGSATNVNLAPLLSLMAGTPPDKQMLVGKLSGPFVLDSSGRTPLALVQALSGQVSVHLAEGEIVGPDVEQALRHTEKTAAGFEGDGRLARTAYSDADGDIEIHNGSATLTIMHIQGPGANLSVTGRADLVDRTLDLTADAQQSGDSDGTGPHVRLTLQGPMTDAKLVLARPAVPELSTSEPAATPPD